MLALKASGSNCLLTSESHYGWHFSGLQVMDQFQFQFLLRKYSANTGLTTVRLDVRFQPLLEIFSPFCALTNVTLGENNPLVGRKTAFLPYSFATVKILVSLEAHAQAFYCIHQSTPATFSVGQDR